MVGREDANPRYTLFQSVGTSFQLRQHAAAHGCLLHHLRDGFHVEPTNDNPFGVPYTRDVGDVNQRVCATCNRACRRHLVGIHVVILAIETERETGYHRHDAGSPQPLDPLDIHGPNVAHESQVRRLLPGGAKHSQVAAAEADCRLTSRADGCNQQLIELPGQHHHGNIARLRIGHAQPIDKCGFATELLQGAAQGGASAMHYDDLMACFAQAGNRPGELLDQLLTVERSPANLDDELHCKPAFSSKPNIRFMFCTACPAAPFKRLSRHDTKTCLLYTSDAADEEDSVD